MKYQISPARPPARRLGGGRSVYERLTSSVEKRVNITLIPSRLFYRLKLGIEIVEPLTHVPLVRLQGIVPRRIIEAQVKPLVSEFLLNYFISVFAQKCNPFFYIQIL